jgi:hypothetical protein
MTSTEYREIVVGAVEPEWRPDLSRTHTYAFVCVDESCRPLHRGRLLLPLLQRDLCGLRPAVPRRPPRDRLYALPGAGETSVDGADKVDLLVPLWERVFRRLGFMAIELTPW